MLHCASGKEGRTGSVQGGVWAFQNKDRGENPSRCKSLENFTRFGQNA